MSAETINETNVAVDTRREGYQLALLMVPTKVGSAGASTKKTIDTSVLNEEDLHTLKRHDPFLYYSIPTVRDAAIRCRSVDLTTLKDPTSNRSRRSSCPSRIESSPSTTVEKKSCISFECHPDLLLEDLDLMNESELAGSDTGVNFDAVFNHMLLRNKMEQ